jgi:hypothetical protein
MDTHRINRAEIEIQAGEVALAEHLIARVSLLRERRIAPLIDRVCSELSGPERPEESVRIDQLELDLGPIALDDFDDDFMRKLEATLRAALRKWLAGQRSAGQTERAAMELLDTFARTGNLPWWVDRGEPELVAHHVRVLLATTPHELMSLLRAIAGNASAIARIARHCDDDLLDEIIARTHEDTGTDLRAGIHELERLLAGGTGASRASLARARGEVLAALARADAREPERVLDALLHELSRWLPSLCDVLATSELPVTPLLREAMRKAQAIAAASRPEHVTGHDREPADARARASSVASRASERTRLADRPDERDASPADDRDASPADQRPFTRERSADHALPRGGMEPDTLARLTGATSPSAVPPVIAATRRGALHQLDELYVDDAGLVILWPFLGHFFLHAGLLDRDHRFADEQAPMQAIALLSQLAIENPEPPEFRVPLAKLLCGLSPEDSFALERPPAPEQLDECERLLAAVIGHASILRDMPVASFRETFLQRSGVLSVRDGAWLLQVERQSHDLVLDRFPWSWSWVKLPWMPDPLRVEW